MTHAFDQLDTVGLSRDAAQAASPGSHPGEVSIRNLRLPPKMREAILRAIQLRCSWGPTPHQHVPLAPCCTASEIERDLAILAHELAQADRLSPTFGRYLDTLAEAASAMASAYNHRLRTAGGKQG